MESKNNSASSNKNCMAFLFTGIIAGFSGFILGLIFAPQSGKNFRKFLAKKFLEVLDRSKFAMIEAKVMAEELLDKSREKSDEE